MSRIPHTAVVLRATRLEASSLRGALATKQSCLPEEGLDGFVAALLAMTARLSFLDRRGGLLGRRRRQGRRGARLLRLRIRTRRLRRNIAGPLAGCCRLGGRRWFCFRARGRLQRLRRLRHLM